MAQKQAANEAKLDKKSDKDVAETQSMGVQMTVEGTQHPQVHQGNSSNKNSSDSRSRISKMDKHGDDEFVSPFAKPQFTPHITPPFNVVQTPSQNQGLHYPVQSMQPMMIGGNT